MSFPRGAAGSCALHDVIDGTADALPGKAACFQKSNINRQSHLRKKKKINVHASFIYSDTETHHYEVNS